MKLTAFGTDTMTGKRIFLEREYPSKKKFRKDMIANGYRSVKVYNEEDMEHLEDILEYKFNSYQQLLNWRKKNGF